MGKPVLRSGFYVNTVNNIAPVLNRKLHACGNFFFGRFPLSGLTFRKLQVQFHIVLFTFIAAPDGGGIAFAGDGNAAGFPCPFRRTGIIGMNRDAVP